ncbi:TVP38/TMEM64 family protein [Rhodovibrio salinarum]|uniref:TVP38/TMEM64 family membrane protein n=1 Tax=Rhodovibrio salinarum TaxID=1087 RepID=A0A934QGS0_9PROT|nr:TVP38/TMEM64 family protein [Rhodovibrio salinarum]MBK1696728.1 TVP38/TMEM64 family protein [Rhodovibrio salinarum]
MTGKTDPQTKGDDPVTPHSTTRTHRPGLRRLWPLLVLLTGLGLFFALGLERYLSFQTLSAHRDWLMAQVREAPMLAALAYVGVYAAVAAFSIPGGAVLTTLGGFLFGTWLGTVYAVTGATIGSLAVFLAARTALGDTLRARAGGAVQRMRTGFQENALSYLLFLRLIPIFPFWLVNLVPAFVGVPLGIYVLGTFIGIIPGTLVYASVGNGLDALVTSGGAPSLGIIFQPEILGPIVGLGLLALLPVAYKKWKARQHGTPETRP